LGVLGVRDADFSHARPPNLFVPGSRSRSHRGNGREGFKTRRLGGVLLWESSVTHELIIRLYWPSPEHQTANPEVSWRPRWRSLKPRYRRWSRLRKSFDRN
jgi:hypothetical protein